MGRFTRKSLFSLLDNFYKEFISDYSDVKKYNKYFPIGRYRKSAEDCNHPLFVNFKKTTSRKSVFIDIVLYLANDYPTDNNETLLMISTYNYDFSFNEYLDAVKEWELDPYLAWEEDLTLFIEESREKYK